MAGEEIVEESDPVEKPICADGQVENVFFNPDNFSKQCAQGSLANLLHVLKCFKEELDLFWNLACSDNVILEKRLGEPAPKKVSNSSDVIKKCLWLLRKQFKFVTTRKLNLKKLTSLNQTLKMLKEVKFPVLIGISSIQTCYDNVVVIWNGIVIDYESKYTFPLTEESLRQVCGANTTFQKVTSGYGHFPQRISVRK
jgi:hypothetical protein